MKIVIVGSGQVGTALAEKLSGEGHAVALVEQRGSRARELSERLDIQVVEGNGATAPVLRRAGAEGADLLVATTDADEVNFVAGRLAGTLFHVPRVVVRLRDPEHEEGFAYLNREAPTDHFFVNPEAAAVEKVASMLDVPGASDVSSFMEGELLVAGYRITEGSEFADRPVSDMRLFFAENPSLVAAIQRGDRTVVPHGAEQIRAGDLVLFAIARSDLDSFTELIGAARHETRHLMIAGASRIGVALARHFRSRRGRVTLVEPDADKARLAAEQLDDTLVVRGRPTSQALLEDEEIDRVDTFVSTMADHESNLVAALLARRMGAYRSFALVDNPALATLIGEAPIDGILSPRLLAIGLILRHVPGARIHAVAALLGDRVEVFEADVEKGSPITAGRLAELSLPRGILVAALRRDGVLRVPRGEDAIQGGDRLVLIAATGQASKLPGLLNAPG